MPKYMDKVRRTAFPDVWLSNPDGRVVAVQGKIVEKQVDTDEGVITKRVYLGHPAIEKADKGEGGWKFASKEAAAKAQAADAKQAEKDRAEMVEMAEKREAAKAVIEVAKEMKKSPRKRKAKGGEDN